MQCDLWKRSIKCPSARVWDVQDTSGDVGALLLAPVCRSLGDVPGPVSLLLTPELSAPGYGSE